MSSFKVQVIVVNPEDESRMTEPIEATVDTGAELTSLPKKLLTGIGIKPRKKRIMVTATGEKVERQVGYAILRAEGFEAIDEVILGEKSDSELLGVRTIEGFGVLVDNVAHRFVTRAYLAL